MAFSNALVLVGLLVTLQGIVAVSESTTASGKSCKTSNDCPDGEGCIGFGIVNGENRLVRCKKFNCVHVSASDMGSFKYWMPEVRAYCCANGFVERSICKFDTTNTGTLATAASTTIATTTTTLRTTAKNPSNSGANGNSQGKSTSSAPADDVDPCSQRNSAHGKFLLSGTFVVKALSPELENKFKKVFLGIVLHCPIMRLDCQFDESDKTVCGYELQYGTRDFADMQLRFLSSVHFRSTINSRLEESGEETLEVVQHAPPSSIYEIETHDSAEDLIMIVAIISAVSAGGVLLLVVIAIVAFAMIAARSPDGDEDPSSLEVARVVAQPGMHIPQSVPPQRGGHYKGSKMNNNNCVSLDLNAAYEQDDDSVFDSAHQANHQRQDSGYSC